ncbi:hypothetical protein Htur_1672 [Haloterrigena turkmenica DSM 5511]|uniref:Uncharacterized protein n=1 Tax=Haloterrigena turkmenica (strain ATCC 51198 / DSM 5511 / JCM 9101 / NCIMB 13204 / VKM B-1734 / 4k) TaxID=543526 RepID=D2RRJ7_HALTV|nr:DUF5804 family protein [Haloterrigena turkmenica]ADB60557.1 hypothetical protein Htur_1672 [Haloterrigena turkmenica DSM 5511]
MTRVCLIGDPDCNLQYELLSRETSREALATYDLRRPFENSISLRTVSVGAAVSLLNDLNWYLTRFVDEALVQEPSVSEDEWLSRALATELRNGDLEPADTAEFCKIYGLERVGPDPDAETEADGDTAASTANGGNTATGDTAKSDESAEAGETRDTATNWRLVEPLYVRRTGGELPTYDLRDVEETLVVRLTEAEHSP